MLSKVEISHKTIIFTLVLLVGAWLLLQVRDIIFLLFLSFIFMAALRPIVDWLEARRIPRVLSILIIYFLVFGVVGFTIAGMIPQLVAQSGKLFSAIPVFLNRMFPYFSLDLQSFSAQIAPIGENLVKVTVGVFSNFVAMVTVMTFTFYFLLERGNMKSILSGLLGSDVGNRVFAVLLRVERRLSAWVLGELMLMLFSTCCTII